MLEDWSSALCRKPCDEIAKPLHLLGKYREWIHPLMVPFQTAFEKTPPEVRDRDTTRARFR